MSRNALLVVAIDFGTTYSGYAFSTKHDFQDDPLRITASMWSSGSQSLMSLKTSSCVLFRPDGTFHSFGFEAEDKYSDLTYDNEHTKWFYYRRFKMQLYDSTNVHRSSMLKDESRKEMPAMDVFAAAIWHLKDHALGACNQRFHGDGMDERDIKWVLTVPAIWDDSAKQFMREAATKAGIPDGNLCLALEPEAASMFCKHLPVEQLTGSSDRHISCFQPRSKYLVLDAGGGTVDITVHEVLQSGKLRELHKANGGAWGGTTIDQAFIGFLKKLTKDTFMEDFRDKYQEDYIDMLREFEVKKRTVRPDMDSRMTFKMPISLYEFYRETFHRELREAIKEKPEYTGRVTLAGDKIRVEAQVVMSFFDDTCESITKHLKTMFETPIAQDTTAILMVGGFSESQMLQNAVRLAFPKRKLIVPNDAGLAVLKGAVIYGHDSTVITARIAKYTYGLKRYAIYNPTIHPKEKMIEKDGELQVRGAFSKLVEVGQSVSSEEKPLKERYSPQKGKSGFAAKLYASTDRDPVFVVDPGCIKIGQVSVDCRNKRGDIGSAYVWLVFGGTELEVHAENERGEITKASFDFLE